jgi:hypothetical protein
MATNYTGSPTATQAPSAAPGPNVAPIVVIPADGEAANVASITQDFKVNADFIAFLTGNGLWKGRVIDDHFMYPSGGAPPTTSWTVTGGATCVDDTANQGSGVISLGAGTSVQSAASFYLGTGDFRFRARVRPFGVAAGSVWKFGINSAGGTLMFLVNGASSTVDWRVEINSVNTAPSGTVAIGASVYYDFELVRVSNVVTFTVNGATLHTQAYATGLTTCQGLASCAGAGSILVDAMMVLVS